MPGTKIEIEKLSLQLFNALEHNQPHNTLFFLQELIYALDLSTADFMETPIGSINHWLKLHSQTTDSTLRPDVSLILEFTPKRNYLASFSLLLNNIDLGFSSQPQLNTLLVDLVANAVAEWDVINCSLPENIYTRSYDLCCPPKDGTIVRLSRQTANNHVALARALGAQH